MPAKLCWSGLFLLLTGNSVAVGQQYSISTVAGGAPPATPVAATSVSIGQPNRVATDAQGNAYLSSGNCVFKLSSGGTLTLVAGNSRPGFSGDGGPAVNAQLNAPQGMAFDSAGNLYIADSGNNRVRVVSTDGTINTFAGNGTRSAPNFQGDGGLATEARLYLPSGLAVDSGGDVFIADTGDNSIREVTTDGNIATVAGNGFPGYGGDAAAAINANLNKPEDVALDSSGNIYIADTGNGLIRKVTSDGNINYIAGDLTIGYSGDGGPATSAALTAPFALAMDSSGNIYFAENGDSRIRKVDSKGNISTIAGTGTPGFSGDNSAATNAQLGWPTGVAVDSSGNVYVADSANLRIRKISSSNISTVAGNGVLSYSGNGGPAVKAQLNLPQGVAVDGAGNFYVADTVNDVVREVAANGTITVFAGTGTAGSGGDGGPAASAQLNGPQGLVWDKAGSLYIADAANHRVRKVSNGTITTYAGTGTAGHSGDGGAATSATLNLPFGLAVDAAANLYIAEFGANVVRKVSAGGSISTVAGNGNAGYSGDGGPATSAQLNGPQGVAVDDGGNLYIADTANNVVRRVTGNVITTIAGTGAAGYGGDGGPATSAQLSSPAGIAVDRARSLYVTDGSAHVRKVDLTSVISTVAGNASRGYSGDGGAATSALLNGPTAVAVDATGNLYVADTGNNAIRLVQFLGTSMNLAAVANGASNLVSAVAPGEIVTLYGSNLGPGQVAYPTIANGVAGSIAGGTQVYMNGAPVPLVYASSTQVAAVVPFSITSGTVLVFVTYQGQTSPPITLSVAPTAPGIFTLNSSGTGQAAALNQDFSLNGAGNPANAGTYVSLYATGGGTISPPLQDGALGVVPLSSTVLTVTVTIGGKDASVNYAGTALNLISGAIQVNAMVPGGLAAGDAPVVMKVGGLSSQTGVTVAVSGK